MNARCLFDRQLREEKEEEEKKKSLAQLIKRKQFNTSPIPNQTPPPFPEITPKSEKLNNIHTILNVVKNQYNKQ